MNNEVYEEVSQDAYAASRIIADMYIKLGRPKDPFSVSGAKMLDIIIAVWQDLYPLQSKMWLEDRKDYKNNELTAREQVRKHTGRSLASYPLPILNIMRRVFRGFDPCERKNCMKIVKKWPIFQMTNKV